MRLAVANSLASAEARIQDALATSARRLSSGLRVAWAADDPSGLAIATNLRTQSQGCDQAARDLQDGTNALAVADGALATVTNLLQVIRALTVQGRSDLLSASDRADVNTEIAALTHEIDATAQNTTFNRVTLFGTATPLAGRVATISRDDTLTSGKPLVDQTSLYVDTTNGANLDFTVTITAYDPVSRDVTVRFDASSPGGSQTFDNTFPQSRPLPTAQPSSTWWIDDANHANRLITLTINQVSAADVGSTFTASTAQAPAASSNLTVPNGAAEGSTTQLRFEPLSAASLGVSAVQIGSGDASNENAQYAVDAAISEISAMRATNGAQTVSLGADITAAATASVNVMASQAQIADVNVGVESTNYAKMRITASIESNIQAQLRRAAFAQAGTLLSALA